MNISKNTIFKIVGLILVVYLLFFIGIYFSFDNWENRGQFGDLFGSVNGLFSAFAFAGLIVSLLIQNNDLQNQNKTLNLQIEALENQRKELELQRKELEMTRKEMKLTREQHEIVAESNKYQVKEIKKQSKINLHLNKMKILQSRFDVLTSILDLNAKGRHRINSSKKLFYEDELTEAFTEYEILGRKKLEELYEEE